MVLKSTPETAQSSTQPVLLWLGLLCTLIILMVVVGGITRLTESGLSIVKWNPISGAIPPLTPESWNKVFTEYQQSPEYRLINRSMNLEDFKSIFFWEWFHRLLGRLIGVVYLIPFLTFWLKGYLSRRQTKMLALGFLLGGLQGVVGWFMVMSGLVDNPRVSHYRLALHLLMALGILSYLFWQLLDFWKGRANGKLIHFRWALPVFSALLALQLTYGAFVAKLKAGMIHNTYPLMSGSLFPDGVWTDSMGWMNLFENPVTIQWIHRHIAVGLFVFAWIIGFKIKQRHPVLGLMLITTVSLQFFLGVATLLTHVQIALAAFHQVFACSLVLVTTALFFFLTKQKHNTAI